MKDLLTRALDAHGGLSRWREIEATALQKAGIDHGAQAAVSMLGAMFRLFWNSSKRVKQGGTDEEILEWCFEKGRRPGRPRLSATRLRRPRVKWP